MNLLFGQTRCNPTCVIPSILAGWANDGYIVDIYLWLRATDEVHLASLVSIPCSLVIGDELRVRRETIDIVNHCMLSISEYIFYILLLFWFQQVYTQFDRGANLVARLSSCSIWQKLPGTKTNLALSELQPSKPMDFPLSIRHWEKVQRHCTSSGPKMMLIIRFIVFWGLYKFPKHIYSVCLKSPNAESKHRSEACEASRNSNEKSNAQFRFAKD